MNLEGRPQEIFEIVVEEFIKSARPVGSEFLAENYDSLFSVTEHRVRCYDKDRNPINHNPRKLIRTQDLSPIYEENSNFYIFSRNSFKKNNN